MADDPRPGWHYDVDGARWPCWICSCGLAYDTEDNARACPCRMR